MPVSDLNSAEGPGDVTILTGPGSRAYDPMSVHVLCSNTAAATKYIKKRFPGVHYIYLGNPNGRQAGSMIFIFREEENLLLFKLMFRSARTHKVDPKTI